MSDIQHKFITNAKKQENMIHNEEKSIKQKKIQISCILYNNNKQKIKLQTISFIIAPNKPIKFPGIAIRKDVDDFYTENFKLCSRTKYFLLLKCHFSLKSPQN